ncbi:MAG TPA: DNA-processing protein DprA [Polyangiaceae bacterium]|nr:DNA-processing protein DprA [Polyangiaceae bacterium]
MAATSRRILAPHFPARLHDLEEPPAALYVRGELPRGPAVAIVGTRKPTSDARRFTRELARELARAGVAILSGGARGIDTSAHRGALLARGVTVVVAPAGFDCPFPQQNARLFARIIERGGCYLSLVADDVAATRPSFFPRNACLVALSHAIVVVEAPWRSGARNAASVARKLGRPLFVVPQAPWNARGRGCIEELRLGARIVESAKDLLKQLAAANLHPLAGLDRSEPGTRRREGGAGSQLALRLPVDDEERVLRSIADGAAHPDEICASTGLPAARVQGLVLTLTLKGALVPAPDGRLRVVI